MKQTKKLLAVLLVLCMIFTLSCTALAVEGEEASADVKAETRAELAKIYADAASISDWAVLPVAECFDLGLMKGDTGSFYPQRTLTRAECAQIIKNLFQLDIDSLTNSGSFEPQGGEEAVAQSDLDNLDNALVGYVERNKDAFTPETLKAVEDAQAAYEKAETNDARAEALKGVQDAVKALAYKPHSFKDVNSKDWYDPAVTAVNALGVMKGTAPDTFDPSVKMTRGMVATVIYRLAGEPDVKDVTCPFTDLTRDWYKDAVAFCSAIGVTKGTSETTFSPDNPITREQMATMFIRFLFGPSLEGKTVVLHSNDVHGNIEGYALMAGLKAEYESKGAEVIVADCGDFSQGTTYVSLSKGANAVTMMNEAGYDVATFGNHEFDFGYENLMNILKDAKFKTICGDVMKDGKSIVDGTVIIEKGGVKVGFFGLETPETYTKVNPGLIQGLSFPQKDELYSCAQGLVDQLKADGADVIIGLVHLGMDAESVGNQSKDLMEHVKGVDMLLDGHSHTVMTPGVAEFKTGVDEEGNDVIVTNPCPDLAIQSTGTKFAYVGVVVIDNATKKIESQTLVPAADITADADVLAKAQELEKAVDDQYGAAFAKSEVDLNGEKAPGNRTEETNMGDLICDSMLWAVLKDADALKVPAENVVAITNGGGIRAPIAKGDVTMKDVNTVLPFGNTVAVVYVTGAELLEALEVSTQVTPEALGGFPQTAGLQITLNTDKAYDAGEQYPDSTYNAPKSIQRVTIESVNGQPFDETATYAVVTNNFCAAGGDTYYVFKNASDQFDTSIPMDEALVNYITDVLGGVIGEQYAEPSGRMLITGGEAAVEALWLPAA